MFTESLFVFLFQDHIFSGGSPIQVVSGIECARVCVETEDCSSYFLNSTGKSCLISTNRYLSASGLISTPGYQYFIMRPECDASWNVIANQCYKFVSSGQSATNAHATCVGMGGFLAKTDSATDNAIIKSFIKKYGSGFWLGGTDEVVEGTWLWRDGSPVTVGYWAVGQPDNASNFDNCVEQWGAFDGWNDGQCWFPLPFLCER